MSIFEENLIEKELTLGSVFNIMTDSLEFAWQDDNDLCQEFFFKWTYGADPDNAVSGVIHRVGELPYSLIQKYLAGDSRPLLRQLKKFIKHKYSNHIHVQGTGQIEICIVQEIMGRMGEDLDLVFKIVLTRL